MTGGRTSSGSATPACTCPRPRPTARTGPCSCCVNNFGFNAGGWRVDEHPRFLADTTGDGRADIVGFGNAGVYVSQAPADGSYGPVQLLVNNFGFNAGGWRVDQHPRFLADTTGRRTRRHRRLRQRRRLRVRAQADGSLRTPCSWSSTTSASTPAAGGSTSTRGSSPTPPGTAAPTSSGSATPASTSRGLSPMGRTARSSWSSTTSGSTPEAGASSQHPRFLADTTGDGRADIVGFGNAGVYVSRAQADGSFGPVSARGRELRLQRRRLARRSTPTVPRRHHRRRPRRHRRVRQRRRLRVEGHRPTARSAPSSCS